MSEHNNDDLLSEGIARLAEGVRADQRREFWTHYWPRRVVPVLLLLILVFGSAVSVGVYSLYGRQNSTDAVVTALRLQAEQSKTSGDAANQQLQQRGQAPVPIPTPGTTSDTAPATPYAPANTPQLSAQSPQATTSRGCGTAS